MSFDKFVNKAKNLANDPKIREKLNSEKAEKATDSILDKAAGVAESLTGGKHTEKIQKARDAADRAVGSDSRRGDDQNHDDASRPGADRPNSDRPSADRPSADPRDDEGEPRP